MLVHYIYDGSFDGFLTAIFDMYERRPAVATIVRDEFATETLFDEIHKVYTDQAKSERVWKGINKKMGTKGAQLIYKAFLGEMIDMERVVKRAIQKGFAGVDIINTYNDLDILKLNQMVKKVDREKHRMNAFIRFRESKDGIYFATIEPDYNVLPLNAKHFKNRYADQKWLIYDLCRNYGLYYDLKKVETVSLAISKDINTSLAAPIYFTEDEMQYQELWKNYFKSTNIASRKNMRLHIQHVPKRYWKYLSEKQPDF